LAKQNKHWKQQRCEYNFAVKSRENTKIAKIGKSKSIGSQKKETSGSNLIIYPFIHGRKITSSTWPLEQPFHCERIIFFLFVSAAWLQLEEKQVKNPDGNRARKFHTVYAQSCIMSIKGKLCNKLLSSTRRCESQLFGTMSKTKIQLCIGLWVNFNSPCIHPPNSLCRLI